MEPRININANPKKGSDDFPLPQGIAEKGHQALFINVPPYTFGITQ